MQEKRKCAHCGRTTNSFYNTRKPIHVCKRCWRKRARKQSRKRRQEMKRKAVEYKGGKCCICGYNRCTDALGFHHTEPDTKSPKLYSYQDGSKTTRNSSNGLSSSGLSHIQSITSFSSDWNLVKAELDKCVLVCARCHIEIEAGLVKL